MRRAFPLLLFLVFIASICLAETHKPAFAGAFYPADRGELSFQINKYLNAAAKTATGEPIALIVPHAGYPYSGPVAAAAYKQVEGSGIKTVIILAASHSLNFEQIALPAYSEFETPLGKVPVDREFINKMKQLNDRIVVSDIPFKNEHAIEVQLPFLQSVLRDFKIVPVLFGAVSLSNCQKLAYVLNYLIDDRTLIIASSDWSHYHPCDQAKQLDAAGINRVIAEDIPGFIRALAEGESEACGSPAIIATMLIAPALGANQIELLKYANSGDITGDRTSVVGYGAILFSRHERVLGAAQRQQLLQIARKAIELAVINKKLAPPNITDEALVEKRGVFVTLTKQGKMRGCIGYIQPTEPLYLLVPVAALLAALKDDRFPPVGGSELKELGIEISVLSKLKKVRDISEIEIGRDGLYLLKGENSGLLLPQVAVEWGWDREQFLKQVCIKAKLPEEAWKEPDTLLYSFTAQIFGD